MKTIFTPLLLIVMTLSFQESNAQAGTLDTSFNHTGKVTTLFANYDYAYAVAIQTDGKIVAAGSSYNNINSSFAVSRYNVNGTPDNTFGTGGKTITDLGTNLFTCEARAVLIQADGKIVLAGYSTGGSGLFMLMRYKTNGIIDSTFGSAGIVTNADGGIGYGAALQTDGKIVVAGKSGSFALARYNVNGSPDSTFGNGISFMTGIITTTIGSSATAYTVAIQADGKIVAAGTSQSGAYSYFTLTRYKTNGAIDSSLGSSGIVTTSFDSTATAYAIAIQTDGKIVASGVTGSGSAAVFALARYNTDGTLDASFGTGGKATTSIGSGGSTAQGVSLQADGKIVAAGFAGNAFAAARYDTNGALDSTFGTGGKVTTLFTGSSCHGEAVTIQADKKIVVAGYVTAAVTRVEFAVARYNADGAVGFAEHNEDNGVNIFPNPAHDRINITSQQMIEEITVTDLLGRETQAYKYAGVQYACLTLPAHEGIYFVRLQTKQGITVRGVIKTN